MSRVKAPRTPGPWSVYHTAGDGRPYALVQADFQGRRDICLVKHEDFHRSLGDARLIAAAPYMLDTLKMVLEDLEAEQVFSNESGVMCRIRFALDMAEPETLPP